MASSATVTSIGVLNVAMDATNESSRPSCSISSGSANGTDDEGPSHSRPPGAGSTG